MGEKSIKEWYKEMDLDTYEKRQEFLKFNPVERKIDYARYIRYTTVTKEIN